MTFDISIGYSKVSSCLNQIFDPFKENNSFGKAGVSAFDSKIDIGCCLGINTFGGQLSNNSPCFIWALFEFYNYSFYNLSNEYFVP